MLPLSKYRVRAWVEMPVVNTQQTLGDHLTLLYLGYQDVRKLIDAKPDDILDPYTRPMLPRTYPVSKYGMFGINNDKPVILLDKDEFLPYPIRLIHTALYTHFKLKGIVPSDTRYNMTRYQPHVSVERTLPESTPPMVRLNVPRLVYRSA